MSDIKRLIRRLKKHDESALEEIIKMYSPLVTTVIYNIGMGTLSKEDIEEAAMDTFITLWKNTDKLKADSFKGYICCIAKSRAFDKLDTKKQGVVLDINEIEIEDEFSLEGSIEQKDINTELRKIIDDMQETDSEIILRYYFYYQKITVIAEKMNLSVSGVKVRLHRARGKIKKQLTERGYDL